MFEPRGAFGSFSVDDLAKAKEFYAGTLGLDVEEAEGMGLQLALPGGGRFFLYPKEDHRPATFTVLTFRVDDIDAAMDDVARRGVRFERYDHLPMDDRGVLRGLAAHRGPDIAWFQDPAGNILGVAQGAPVGAGDRSAG